jgi:hypothetical protein
LTLHSLGKSGGGGSGGGGAQLSIDSQTSVKTHDMLKTVHTDRDCLSVFLLSLCSSSGMSPHFSGFSLLPISFTLLDVNPFWSTPEITNSIIRIVGTLKDLCSFCLYLCRSLDCRFFFCSAIIFLGLSQHQCEVCSCGPEFYFRQSADAWDPSPPDFCRQLSRNVDV